MQWVYDHKFYNQWYDIKEYGGRPCFLESICDDHYYTILPLHKLNEPTYGKGKLKYKNNYDRIFTHNTNTYGTIVAKKRGKKYKVTFISRGDKHDAIFAKYTKGYQEIYG
jgi:hypothetical protein